MWKHRWILSTIVLCLQCGGQKEASPPAEEPTPAVEEPTPPTEEAATPTPEETPAEEPKTEEPAGEPKGGEPKGDGDPVCAKLDKTKCKITKGCAWNDIKKCVEDEGGP